MKLLEKHISGFWMILGCVEHGHAKSVNRLKPLQPEMIQCVPPFALSTLIQSMPNSYSTNPTPN